MYAPQDLSAFLAVAETGSVRAAAERIGRTQSAVSQALKRLEVQVGFLLMDRSDYRLRLSPRGEQFARRVAALVKQGEGLRQFARVLAAGTEERVNLTVHGALPASAWAQALGRVGSVFPDTVLEVVAGEVDGPIAALAEGRADLALLLMPPSSAGLDLMEHRRLGRLGFANVVRADLADAAVQALPQIVVSDFAPASRSFGVVEGRRYWRVSSHAMKADLVLAGLGWGSLPAHLVETPLREGQLKAVERLGQGRSDHDIFLYRRADAPRGPVAAALWEAFGG